MTLDDSFRELLREIVRDEIRPLRDELRSTIEASAKLGASSRSESAGFLTVEDVAEIMKVTGATVRSWIKSGALADPSSEILRHHKDLRPKAGNFKELRFGVSSRLNPLESEQSHSV